MEYLVNQATKIAFTSTGLATGQTVFTHSFLVNGNVVAVTPTFTEIGAGLYTANFTPTVTGRWVLFIGGKTYEFEVVSKTLQNGVGELLDESLGSWSWNKSTGLLTLFRGDGSTLATYNVVDTVQAASRERLT
jgi:hypothetical protein